MVGGEFYGTQLVGLVSQNTSGYVIFFARVEALGVYGDAPKITYLRRVLLQLLWREDSLWVVSILKYL
jgi:hypothetical protein